MTIFADETAAVMSLRNDRLVLAADDYLAGITLDDEFLYAKILAAEAETSRILRVFFEPTVIFAYTPSSAEITALAGAPYQVEPAYDYDPSFFQGDRWGYLVTRQHPIVSIDLIQFAYPNPSNTVFVIPPSWIRPDLKYGHIRMVPASQAFAAPLGAFLLQAMGGGQLIPAMIQMRYTAGLQNAAVAWPDLVNVILKKAVLDIIGDRFLPQSASISADGLSQSMSFDLAKYQDIIDLKLFGPKGSNGGLWTAIHGIVGTALGVMA